MVNHFDYYTGIIFRGYTYGTGDAIGKGGRYDNLLMQFGKNAPAIGFTILVDDMLSALDRQISRCPSVSLSIPYSFIIEKKCRKRFIWRWICEAVGTKVECICMEAADRAGEYISFAKSQGAHSVFILDGDGLIIHDFSAGRVAKTSLANFRREY